MEHQLRREVEHTTSCVANRPIGTHGPRAASLRGSTLSHQSVRCVLRARRARPFFMNGDLFAEPAWDMLLELFALKLEQRRISVTSLCAASGTPATTALRWVAKLEAENLIVRAPDPHDRRRIFVELSTDGETAMRHYFDALPAGLVLPGCSS